MKLTKVIPIFKSVNKNLFNNYRTISILPAYSKLLKTIVATKLVHLLETNNVLYTHQYGFRRKHSTIYPIVHLLKYVLDSNDKPSKEVNKDCFWTYVKHLTLLTIQLLSK